jgi:hypothetical protein
MHIQKCTKRYYELKNPLSWTVAGIQTQANLKG